MMKLSATADDFFNLETLNQKLEQLKRQEKFKIKIAWVKHCYLGVGLWELIQVKYP